MMSTHINYQQAVIDFREARHKAEIQGIFSRLSGDSNKLLSYEEVRQKLRAYEGNTTTLEEIPMDAIIGSVGRYTDFTRDFLPRRDSVRSRWTAIMEKALGSQGLPPIEVYQVGEAYFVIDGNHRVSVARKLGASHIHAYVTKVQSRVPLSPDTQPDDLLLKAELTNFLEHTQIDKLRPGADLRLTLPGQYPILEEHIAVHRYFMGIEQQRQIPYEEAVTHWYDQVYLPVVSLIQERGILERFPQRTETDLYLWLAKHREELEESLGWKMKPEMVVEDLVETYSVDFSQTLTRLASRILDVVTPDPLEAGPPTGQWRHEREEQGSDSTLFGKLLVALDQDERHWYAFDQAVVIAKKENAVLRGLHIVPKTHKKDGAMVQELQAHFQDRCAQAGVQGELAVDSGKIARQICERAHWADLVVTHLAHPPGETPFERLSSGFRTMIRRCSSPILAVPSRVSRLDRVILAFNNKPKALEALYLAAYIAGKWGAQLGVATIRLGDQDVSETQGAARSYLARHGLQAEFIVREGGPVAGGILEAAKAYEANLVLVGGYEANPLIEVLQGSVVDQILRSTNIPILICR